jgi:hypothetical protein
MKKSSEEKTKYKIKEAGIIIIMFISVILSINYGSATIVGVSPPEISFNNVLRNGYAERTIIISIDSIEPIPVEVSSRGEISSWINVSSNYFNVSKDNPYQLKVFIIPPNDIPSGDYDGFLTLSTGGFGEGVKGQAVGIVRTAVEPYLKVSVSDIEIRECSAKGFEVESVEKGDDIVFKLKFANNGNIRLKPKIKIDLWDKDQLKIIKSEDFNEKDVAPTTESDLSLRIDSSELEVGQYFADISLAECYSKETLTFDVLEPGALKASGILTSILAPKTVKVGENVKIIVNFRNTGEKEVEAQFKGSVNKGGKIVQVLESEKNFIPIGEANSFDFYFNPKEVGKYVVSGRVYYSNKKTFESSTSFDAVSDKSAYLSIIISAIYIVLIVSIVILFYKINKQRIRYHQKIRGLKIK